ncbi:extracellular solute-binding protein [Clostridium sp. UBA1652]|uniref:ABC transporter substrate-binding protein n=1 Tax=Clostridium sp. UBA1652 TaxID=1946348 RepID=UPI00257D936F|nr:extracellular solute-binding protein [Clostridium sp. UBA1652]
MKKYICFLLVLILGFMPVACKKIDKSRDKEVIVLVENNSIPIMDNLNKILDKFKESNSEINLQIITKDNIKDAISNKDLSPDILITTRSSFIEIFKENELQAIDEIIKEEKYNENFYNINTSSGRLKDKYYGIGAFPYTIDFLYNPKALEKLNIKIPENSADMLNLLKTLRDKNIKIPYILPEEVSLELALSSYIANFLLVSSQLKDIYGDSEEDYKKLESMQQMFSIMNSIVSSGQFNLTNFYVGSEHNIEELENEEIPILIGTSFLSKNIKKVNSIKSISNINLTENTMFSPVGLGAMISLYAEGKNKDSSRKLLGYLVKEDMYSDLSKEGIIVANKNLDMSLEGVRGAMAKNIVNANENNVFYFYNIPKKYLSSLKEKLKEVMNGKYDGNEWNDIIK